MKHACILREITNTKRAADEAQLQAWGREAVDELGRLAEVYATEGDFHCMLRNSKIMPAAVPSLKVLSIINIVKKEAERQGYQFVVFSGDNRYPKDLEFKLTWEANMSVNQ